MKGKNGFFNRILIFLFAGMLVLPNLFFNRIPNAVSEIENRILAQKPLMFEIDGHINPNYISEFEEYFDDNIGFKEKSTALNIVLKYKLFGVLDIPNWMMGKNGNLFYTTGGEDIRTYVGANRYDENTVKEMAEDLEKMNIFFEQMGCKTYNLFIPNKEAIYSEFYNPYAHHAEESRMDLFENYLNNNTNLTILNLKDALRDNKSEMLYFKSYDASHWNMNGAYIGYLELMNLLKEDFPWLEVLPRDAFDIGTEDYVGLMQYQDGNRFISENFDLTDTIYFYNLKGGWHASLDSEPLNGKDIDPNLNFYHFHNDMVENNEVLMIVGDSYIYCFLLPIIAESFRDVYFVRNAPANIIKDMTVEIKPTIFVFEVAERVFSKYYFDYMKEYAE